MRRPRGRAFMPGGRHGRARAAVRRYQAAIEGSGHFLASHGWQMEGKKVIVGHGGHVTFVAQEERRFDIDFLPDHNDLGHVCHHNIRPGMNKAGCDLSDFLGPPQPLTVRMIIRNVHQNTLNVENIVQVRGFDELHNISFQGVPLCFHSLTKLCPKNRSNAALHSRDG